MGRGFQRVAELRRLAVHLHAPGPEQMGLSRAMARAGAAVADKLRPYGPSAITIRSRCGQSRPLSPAPSACINLKKTSVFFCTPTKLRQESLPVLYAEIGMSEAVCTAWSPGACPRMKNPLWSVERCSGLPEYPFPANSLLMLPGKRLSMTVSRLVIQVSYRSPLAPYPKRIFPSTS